MGCLKDNDPDDLFYFCKWDWRCWLATAVTAAFLGVSLYSSQIFNSKAYNQMLKVQEVKFDNFSTDINVIPVEKMLVADQNIAQKVAEDRLEEDPGLGSRCIIGRMTLQNLNGSFTIDDGRKLSFDNDPVWVAPVPEGQKSAFLVKAILDSTRQDALESTLRRILREELQAVPSQPVQQPEEAIPPEMLGFLNTLMDDG